MFYVIQSPFSSFDIFMYIKRLLFAGLWADEISATGTGERIRSAQIESVEKDR